jgi:hypothetical protein
MACELSRLVLRIHHSYSCLLFRSEGNHWVQARSAPCWNEACPGSDQQQYCNDGTKYGRIEWADAIQHGADQLCRGDAANNSKYEPEKSWAKSVKEHKTEHLLSLRSQGNADANFSGSLGDDVGKDSEEADCSQSQR